MLSPKAKKGTTGSEKDFIIVNYTHSYIMLIEVKSNLTTKKAQNEKLSPLEKCMEQLKEGFEIFQELFGSEDIDGLWWFIPMIYCSKMDNGVEEMSKKILNQIFCQTVDKSFSTKIPRTQKPSDQNTSLRSCRLRPKLGPNHIYADWRNLC